MKNKIITTKKESVFRSWWGNMRHTNSNSFCGNSYISNALISINSKRKKYVILSLKNFFTQTGPALRYFCPKLPHYCPKYSPIPHSLTSPYRGNSCPASYQVIERCNSTSQIDKRVQSKDTVRYNSTSVHLIFCINKCMHLHYINDISNL